MRASERERDHQKEGQKSFRKLARQLMTALLATILLTCQHRCSQAQNTWIVLGVGVVVVAKLLTTTLFWELCCSEVATI